MSSLEQTHLVWWPILPLHPGYVAALEFVKITVNLEQKDGMILTSTWPSNLATPILHNEQNYNSLHLEKLITISLELIDGIMFSLKWKISNPLLHRHTYYALGMTYLHRLFIAHPWKFPEVSKWIISDCIQPSIAKPLRGPSLPKVKHASAAPLHLLQMLALEQGDYWEASAWAC